MGFYEQNDSKDFGAGRSDKACPQFRQKNSFIEPHMAGQGRLAIHE